MSENGYGKRTDVDRYRLQSRGGTGVINMNANAKTGKVTAINLVDDTTEMMLISQFGKIIRIDTKASPRRRPQAPAASSSSTSKTETK